MNHHRTLNGGFHIIRSPKLNLPPFCVRFCQRSITYWLIYKYCMICLHFCTRIIKRIIIQLHHTFIDWPYRAGLSFHSSRVTILCKIHCVVFLLLVYVGRFNLIFAGSFKFYSWYTWLEKSGSHSANSFSSYFASERTYEWLPQPSSGGRKIFGGFRSAPLKFLWKIRDVIIFVVTTSEFSQAN